MLTIPDRSMLDAHPFFAAVDLLAARHHISADAAQRRLEDIAENLGIPGIELAELMLYEAVSCD